MRTSIGLLALVLVAVHGAAWAQSTDSRVARDREFADGARLEPDLHMAPSCFKAALPATARTGAAPRMARSLQSPDNMAASCSSSSRTFATTSAGMSACSISPISHHLAGAQDLTDVAAYVANLPRFPPTAKGIGDGAALGKGASIYFQKCERCHGPLGQGNLLLNRPRLAGQHYGYLLRQLQETAADNRPGMDRAHVEMLRGISPESLSGVADYLSRVSPDLSSIEGR